MRSPWFHFQQFSLRQDKSGMKITTDACAFGAWAAARVGAAKHILDIGTGTGLLTLMLAQRKKADLAVKLEAIEIDPPSHKEASANFSASPWVAQITLHQGDVRKFHFPAPFGFVIVNPPFYERQLLSPKAVINQARHDSGLVFDELIRILKKVLTPTGKFAILLPAEREACFSALATDAGFYAVECCRLKATPAQAPFRSLLLYDTSEEDTLKKSADYRVPSTLITIRDAEGKETPELLSLMGDYYIR